MGFVQIATIILALMQFVGSTCILIYGVEESSTLTTLLQEKIMLKVHEWDIDSKARAQLANLMEYVSGTRH